MEDHFIYQSMFLKNKIEMNLKEKQTEDLLKTNKVESVLKKIKEN